MVKRKTSKKNGTKTRRYKEKCRLKRKRKRQREKAVRITANTPHGTCTEQLSPFGGLLAYIKFIDLVDFKNLFNEIYCPPKRTPKLGHYTMVMGMLMLLNIGFTRIGHFIHIGMDSLVCGILSVEKLPVVSTFWRYLNSLGLNQSKALLSLSTHIRRRVWDLCDYHPRKITINIDTTVATVYGNTQGGRKGHNTKHRGKKGLRPVLCFIEETKEYLCGNQRKGETITISDVAALIRQFQERIGVPIKEVLVRGDGEFIGEESVAACWERGFHFIFGNRRCTPPFPDDGWYRHGVYEFNECYYQPTDWKSEERFVVMRIKKADTDKGQMDLFEEDQYTYRVFVTSLNKKPHLAIADYDPRAGVENLIGEAQREGILAIPSKKFKNNHAFFQFVMLAYNIWRWIQLLGATYESSESGQPERKDSQPPPVKNTIRLARLKTLYVAAKVVFHGNRTHVNYSIHDHRASELRAFLDFLDSLRKPKLAPG